MRGKTVKDKTTITLVQHLSVNRTKMKKAIDNADYVKADALVAVIQEIENELFDRGVPVPPEKTKKAYTA